MKLLFLDIETSPNTAHVWGLFNQNIGLSQLRESSRVLCWAAKWQGGDEIIFDSEHQSRHKTMIKRIYKLLEQADAVCHYNGTKFDIPTLQKEFLKYGYPPPSPFAQIDLLRTSRNQFKFPSNKLDYVAGQLGLGKKTAHEGHELWLKCMEGDDDAWDRMETYNKNDVVLLEGLYDKFLPWIKKHPNRSAHAMDIRCPNCGGTHLQSRGFAIGLSGKYRRFQCTDCGKWSSSNKVAVKTKLPERLKGL